MKTWPNIYAQGTGFIVDCGVIDGKRDRKRFSTISAAQTEAKRRREERRRGREGALSISDSDLLDAVAATRILAGTGITLESLARKAIEDGARCSMMLSELYARYHAAKQTSGIRPRSLKNIEAREGRFAGDLGFLPLSEITSAVITQWLEKNHWRGESRNTFLRAVRSLLAYAVKNDWLGRNPALAVDFSKSAQALPTVFSVETVRTIFRWLVSSHPDDVPYYAIAFFSGIRPEEIKRLTLSDFDFGQGIITVSPGASKTHMRHVDIQPNLKSWLKAYPPPETGPICWSRRHYRAMISALSLDWGHDIARKTFISYHLAAFRNQHETALQAGHRSTDMIFTVYRNIASTDGQKLTQPYAETYWKIRPKNLFEQKKCSTSRNRNRKKAEKLLARAGA